MLVFQDEERKAVEWYGISNDTAYKLYTPAECFDDGKVKASITLATNNKYKNQSGELVSDTQWHNVVAWGNTAKIAENYLVKGKEVAIEGKLTSRSYETKEGEKRYITEVVCNELMMLGNK